MALNGLNTISQFISANSSSQMDPLKRVLSFDRALLDGESSVGPSRIGVPDTGAAEERAADEIPVDELIREFELDREGDLIEDGPVDGTRRSAQTDSPGVIEEDYARVGVRNLEWRLPVIRSAAHRSADAIASGQLVEPSETQENQLAKIVLSTYRLIDPRCRGSYFQQVRVGRTLPMVLQTASCVDGTPPSLQPTIASDPTHCVRLFGHSIPVAVSPSAVAVHRRVSGDRDSTVRSLRPPSTQPRRKRNHHVPARSHFQTEAVEVLAELQSRSRLGEWTLWFQGTRLIAMLTTVACVCVTIIAAYRLALPLRKIGASPAPITNQSRDNYLPRPSRPLESTSTARPVQPQPPKVLPTRSPARVSEKYVPAKPTTNLSASDRMVLETDMSPTVTDPKIKHPELTTAQLMAALARVTDIPNMESRELNTPVRSKPVLPVNPPSARNPSTAASPSTVSTPGASNPSQFDEPKLPSTDRSAALDEAAIASAVLTLWSETESAAGRFTESSAPDLIDAWDLIADLAADGSAENLAAERLVRQASWLIHPVRKIVADIRKMDPLISSTFSNASESDLQNTGNLNANEVQKLLSSWQAARTRVTRTSDLNQMLRQANVLLDRIIISDQLSPDERNNFLASFHIDVEKLSQISSDKDATAETANLFAAMDTLPNPSEWARLVAAVRPSGMVASMYCLQQRRWDRGITALGQASNPAVAHVANEEWNLIKTEQLGAASESTDMMARATLANRWSKIAERLTPREAAAVRLHAIELYGDEPETEMQRKALESQLPKYVQ